MNRDPERPMTADDWGSLAVLATNAEHMARAGHGTAYVFQAAYYRALAVKAALRADAARDGRCVP